MDFLYTIVGFVQADGAFMYPILIVFAVGSAVAIERIVMLARVRGKNRKVWDSLHPVMSEGDFDEARKLTSEDDSFISQLLGMGLAREGAVRRRDDIEIAMEESMMEIIPQLEKRTASSSILPSPPFSKGVNPKTSRHITSLSMQK